MPRNCPFIPEPNLGPRQVCHELQHLIGCYYILFSANQIQEILLSDKNIINMSNVRRCGGWVIKLQFGYKGGLDQYLCLYPNIDKPLGQIRFLVNCPPTPPLSQCCLLYFSLRAKCWLRGGVGGQFLKNLNSDPVVCQCLDISIWV